MTNHVKEGLATCPFCGEPPVVRDDYNNEARWYIECDCPQHDGMTVKTWDFPTMEAAAAAWNRRAPSSKSDEQVSASAADIDEVLGGLADLVEGDLVDEDQATALLKAKVLLAELHASRIPDKGEVVAAYRTGHADGRAGGTSETVDDDAESFLATWGDSGPVPGVDFGDEHDASPQPSSGSEVVVTDDEPEMPTLEAAYSAALVASRVFADVASVEETNWTGWGEQTVPDEATWRRVKAEQACSALRDADPHMLSTLQGAS